MGNLCGKQSSDLDNPPSISSGRVLGAGVPRPIHGEPTSSIPSKGAPTLKTKSKPPKVTGPGRTLGGSTTGTTTSGGGGGATLGSSTGDGSAVLDPRKAAAQAAVAREKANAPARKGMKVKNYTPPPTQLLWD